MSNGIVVMRYMCHGSYCSLVQLTKPYRSTGPEHDLLSLGGCVIHIQFFLEMTKIFVLDIIQIFGTLTLAYPRTLLINGNLSDHLGYQT